MITDLFAQDTSASDYATEAKADIWADYEDFSAKAATTTERANALVAATAEGRGATMKAFGALGSSCRAATTTTVKTIRHSCSPSAPN